jgi:Xaa-Pro aminopeptidase
MDHEARVAGAAAALEAKGVDALLVTDRANVRYLTGFSGTNGQVLVTGSGAVFFTDPRYEARAGALVQGARIDVYRDRLTDRLPDHLGGVERLGIEADTMTVGERDRLAARLSGVELASTSGVVEGLRQVKDPEEVALLRDAIALGDEAFDWVLDRLVPGATERQIALDLEVHMREQGAESVSFEPIVGSGPLSAHIHHTPSDRALEKGDLVLLDFGCRKEGYCSDLTRTVVLGAATDEQRAQYELVLRAQAAGISAVAPGATGKGVDASARSLVEEAGEGDAFGHGLGHGVGLDIHEAPRLARISEDTLQAGEVVTIEPGVYHVGTGGIRIEDCVLVTEQGPEVLGRAPKDELIEL